MTPYFSQDGITLYHGDCREVLPILGRFDLLLTDPPYGLGEKWNGGGGGAKSSWGFRPQEAKAWDAETAGDLSVFIAAADDAIVWGGNYYALPPARCWLLWDKKQPDTWTTGQAEMAWTTFDKPIRAYRLSQCEAHSAMEKQHPTQKPLSLMQWCFKWAPDAKTILDPFAGSGTTLLAAKLEGRRAVGIEISERYCEIAANRLRQKVLF